VDSQQAADASNDGHVGEDGDGFLDGGFAGSVGCQHDFRARHIATQCQAADLLRRLPRETEAPFMSPAVAASPASATVPPAPEGAGELSDAERRVAMLAVQTPSRLRRVKSL